MSHTLAVITVVYQNYRVLEDFFSSLKNQSVKDFKLFLTDQSPSPQNIATPTFACDVSHSANLGYAHGVNVGLAQASTQAYDYFCVINTDTVVDRLFVAKMLYSLKNHPGSIIGGKIYYAKGFEYHHNRYAKNELGSVLWYAGGGVDYQNGLTFHRGVDKVDHKQYDNFEKTDFVTGCLLGFDRSVLHKVGFWDENYFMYFEDADFCERAKQQTITLYYDSAIVIWHKNAQSTGGAGSPLHQKFQRNSRLRFTLKYMPLWTKLHLLKNALFNRW
ncbi:glycosyltransferase family 2 protein [Candidatus Roizmanbacteria bacterium]|nr:glycosyltransferase family 2 protein [Candidatus Roizmanbacteria bacterium]